jgi:hypothetical protein
MLKKFIVICTIIQLSLIIGLYYYYNTLKEYRCTCLKYKTTFPLAKASAALINLSSALSLISIVRLPKLFVYIPFKLKYLHIYFSVSLFIWSIIHSISHYVKFIQFKYPLFTSGIGITGNLLLLLLLLVSGLSLPIVRRLKYQTFLYFHYVFLVIYSIILLLHGNFCFIKNDKGMCPKATSWIWLTIPLIYLFVCTLYKFTRSTTIKKVAHMGNNIVKLELNLPNNYNGKTIWLCCPDISYLEWHPFTITTNGTVYFKIRGDWTTTFYNLLSKDINRKLLIEGPYHALPKNINNIIKERQTVFISTGVGITSFVNMFNEIDNEYIYNLHVILVVRYEQEIDWLLPILNDIYKYKNVNIKLYFTGNVPHYILEYIEIPYIIGRPNFNDILTYNKVKNECTNIYYSGKTKVGREIQGICNKIKKYNYYDVN